MDALAQPRLGPSKGWYAVAAAMAAVAMAAVAIAAVVWTEASLFVNVFPDFTDMQRLAIPGEKDLTFAQAGRYTVYRDNEGAEAGEMIEAGPLSDQVSCKLLDAGGKEVMLGPVAGSETYTVGQHSGKAIYHFTIESPGKCRFSAALPNVGQKAVLAVGRSLEIESVERSLEIGPVGRQIVVMSLAFLVFLAAIVIAIVTAAKRSNNARRLALEAQPTQIPGQRPPQPL